MALLVQIMMTISNAQSFFGIFRSRKGEAMEQLVTKEQHLFETVIVGVDFSKYSKIVFKQAQSLARQLKAKLVIVYADWLEWQMPSPEIFLPVPQPDVDELRQSVESFYNIQPADQTSIKILHGTVPESILKVANRYPTPLIVVGSQGKSAVSRYILGSNAESIALKSPYPVWVHRGRKVVPLRKLLIPTDLSQSSHHQIDEFRKWSKRLHLSLNYLFVKPEVLPMLQYSEYKETALNIQNNINSSINKFKRRSSKPSLVTATGDNPSEVISRAGKKYDVIAMNPHNRTGLFNRFGRVTSKVIRLADNPVLVMRGA
jgi:nucleotide-binding universal stress UspA family protein